MSNLFWNTTLCAVNTLCTESWPLIPLRSSWIIIPRPSISEGTISLFVTVIAMLIVALFFRIHNYLWCPSYDAKSREEEGEWLMIANGISNACVGWALLLGGVGIVRRRIRVWSFILAIGFPLASWALISTISGLTQLSIHSVVALQQKMQKMTIQACNLTSLITLFDGTDFSQPKLLDRTSVLPVGSSEEVGAALISGLSQNFTSFLFTHEGMLCSGQYFQNSYFTTQCLVGRAVCNSTRLTVNPTTGIVSSSSTPMSAPVPYIGDRLNVSQLRIISTSNNSITHPTNPSRQGAALSSLTIQYGYTSNSAIPYANIETWKPNQTIYTKTSNTAVSRLSAFTLPLESQRTTGVEPATNPSTVATSPSPTVAPPPSQTVKSKPSTAGKDETLQPQRLHPSPSQESVKTRLGLVKSGVAIPSSPPPSSTS
ncbi:hypothetical protein BC829DRAFT_230535 [Chytridium lagenaria]|nr:hypothetical protein BC829DRAFT_230535 [Chytridium lagenaria]